MAQTDHPRIRLHAAERHRKAPSLYRLAFDDVVFDLLKVKPAATSERAAQKAEARLKTARKWSRRKGSGEAMESRYAYSVSDVIGKR